MRSLLFLLLISFSVVASATSQSAESWFSLDQETVVVRAHCTDKQMLADLGGQRGCLDD